MRMPQIIAAVCRAVVDQMDRVNTAATCMFGTARGLHLGSMYLGEPCRGGHPRLGLRLKTRKSEHRQGRPASPWGLPAPCLTRCG